MERIVDVGFLMAGVSLGVLMASVMVPGLEFYSVYWGTWRGM